MIEAGTYGAKVQSWNKANPRDLLKAIMDENPSMEKPALLATLRHELLAERSADLLDSVIEYWFANNYNSLVAPIRRAAPSVVPATPTTPVRTVAPVSPAAKAAAAKERVETIKEKVKTRILEEAQLMLLDLTMPNGKALRDSTGKECAKAGGWFTKIALRVPPGSKVGKALSEEQVRALWKTR